MKISTAMNLGSSMIFPIAGQHLNVDRTGGCAWGMVNVAAPGEYENMLNMRAHRVYLRLPCGCKGNIMGAGMKSIYYPDGKLNLTYAIVHLFNDHVMTRKDWSMEKLIDWVASVEPPDPFEVQDAQETEVEVSDRAPVLAEAR